MSSRSGVHDKDLDHLSKVYGFSGSFLVSEGGKPLIEKYFGKASDHNNLPIDETTPISMASGSKMFTAILIGCAIEDGLIQSVDQPGV